VQQAKEWYLKSIDLLQATLHANHPALADSLVCLARAQRDLEEAEAALATCSKAEALVPKSPTRQYVGVLNMKADALRENKRLKEAEVQSRLALEVQESIPGGERTPEFAIVLNSLANIVHDQTRVQEATEIYMRAIKVNILTVGMYNAETAASYNNLASAYQDLGMDAEAEENYYKCLHIQQKIFSSDNPDLATVYNNIASVLINQKRYQEALNVVSKAVEVARSAGLPENHPGRKLYEDNAAEIRHQLAVSSGWLGKVGQPQHQHVSSEEAAEESKPESESAEEEDGQEEGTMLDRLTKIV